MICQGMDDRLNGYVDGDLGDAERREVERHLLACPACRAEVEELRALISRVASLPKEIEPAEDLWPETAAAIRRPRPSGAGGRAGSRAAHAWWARPSFALAAAAVLIVISAAVTTLLVRGPSAPPAAGPPAPSSGTAPGVIGASAGILPDLAAAEAEYDRATQSLLEVLRGRQAELPPGTMAVIEKNLRVIDQAIAETRAALERDPSNARLGRMVTARYQMKVDLLREAARLPAPV